MIANCVYKRAMGVLCIGIRCSASCDSTRVVSGGHHGSIN